MTPIRVLFICHGNICRSPMAEFIMKDLVRRAGRADDFHIESAATSSEEIWGEVGNPVYPPAVEELAAHGIGVPGNELGVQEKRARLLTKEDYNRFDYLIGMDGKNLRGMKRILGEDPEHKVSLLLDFTNRPGDVADPWYTRNFKNTWYDVEEGCKGLLEHITNL